MLNTWAPPHHCCFLTLPIKLAHSSPSHPPSTTRIRPSNFSTGIFHPLSAIDKHRQNKQNHQNQDPDGDYDADQHPIYNTSPIYLNEIKRDSNRKRGEFGIGILSNMWWAELKGAVGQRINVEGVLFSVSVITRNKHWVIPHVSVPDVRYIDWAALKRKGFEGVVFDKDNTLTVPYSLALYGPLSSSVEACKSVFGNNIAVFSNSAGLLEYDPDGRKARALEYVIGIRVIRHSKSLN